MHKHRLRLGVAPYPAGELTALPRPIAGLKRSILTEGDRMGGKDGRIDGWLGFNDNINVEIVAPPTVQSTAKI